MPFLPFLIPDDHTAGDLNPTQSPVIWAFTVKFDADTLRLPNGKEGFRGDCEGGESGTTTGRPMFVQDQEVALLFCVVWWL